MRDFSYDKINEYSSFTIKWKLISQSLSSGTSIKLFESDSPIKRRKSLKEVRENDRGTKIIYSLSRPI